jgi:3-methyl-2-oxobutanoate hydroxymethyltransferase
MSSPDLLARILQMKEQQQKFACLTAYDASFARILETEGIGYKVQGRKQEDADRILTDAQNLTEAGIKMLVLECIPQQLASKITDAVTIPTIGIGAGINCDGQILVLYDVLGVSSYIPKMANDFLKQGGDIRGAVRHYIKAVRSGLFPASEQSFD